MENIEKMVQEALDSTKSAHKRIDRMEKRQDNLEELTNAFSVLQNEQEHIKTDVGGNQGRCEAAGFQAGKALGWAD